jgi:hypothetical protein
MFFSVWNNHEWCLNIDCSFIPHYSLIFNVYSIKGKLWLLTVWMTSALVWLLWKKWKSTFKIHLSGSDLKLSVQVSQLLCYVYIPQLIFRQVWKNCKKQQVPHVYPCVRMEQLSSHWTDIHEIVYMSISWKSVKKSQESLKSYKNSEYFTWRTIYIYILLSSS